MNKIFYDTFSGGGGAATGAKAAGLDPRFGLELMPEIAEWYNRNLGHHCVTGNVLGFDFTSLEPPWWFHGSPPCTTASQANQDAKETELDRDLARALCRAIRDLRPPWFSLENVGNYRNYQSFRLILATLKDEGYAIVYRVLDAADYGVPQNRKRLILVASRVGRPVLPVPTHINPVKLPNDSQLSLLSLPLPWVGWYEAISDLIDDLPESSFAPWQIKLLPKSLKTSIIGNSGYDGKIQIQAKNKPMNTLTANHNQTNLRAYIIDNKTSRNGTAVTARDGSNPMYTLTPYGKSTPNAYVGRVVKLSTRCLARFNGLPDSYQLPSNQTLSCKILGNMVMPGLMQRVIEANL